MNKGKAADVFELTVENILYGGDELLYIIHKIIVAISREGHIPDLLKTLPTIWGTYMKLVTKYQISAINSC